MRASTREREREKGCGGERVWKREVVDRKDRERGTGDRVRGMG